VFVQLNWAVKIRSPFLVCKSLTPHSILPPPQPTCLQTVTMQTLSFHFTKRPALVSCDGEDRIPHPVLSCPPLPLLVFAFACPLRLFFLLCCPCGPECAPSLRLLCLYFRSGHYKSTCMNSMQTGTYSLKLDQRTAEVSCRECGDVWWIASVLRQCIWLIFSYVCLATLSPASVCSVVQ
jgi:hypothetical protein